MAWLIFVNHRRYSKKTYLCVYIFLGNWIYVIRGLLPSYLWKLTYRTQKTCRQRNIIVHKSENRFEKKEPKLKKTRWNCIVYKVNSFYANILLNLLTANILRCTRKNIFYLVSKSQHQFIYCPNQRSCRIGLLYRVEN